MARRPGYEVEFLTLEMLEAIAAELEVLAAELKARAATLESTVSLIKREVSERKLRRG